MKKIVLTVVCVAVAVFIVSSTLSEFRIFAAAGSGDSDYAERFKTSDDSAWAIVKSGAAELKNDFWSLKMDAASTRFSVTDLQTQKTYHSYPEKETAASSPAEQAKLTSNLAITYYDADSKELTMASGPDSVENGNFVIKQSGNSLRVYYTFGTSVSDVFAPKVVKKEQFESILASLGSGSDRRRLKIYYSLFSSEQKDDDYREMLKKYPALSKGDLYILDEEVDKTALSEITGYMNQSGYTREQYAKDLEEMEIEQEASELPAGFVVPLELTLTQDGFTAKVLMDKITSNNETDRLVRVSILDYFGAADSKTDGWFFVPDGSGALIQMNQQVSVTYNQPVFSRDYAKELKEQKQLSQNVLLPVFGASYSGGGGFVAMIEEAAACATIGAKTIGSANPLNNVYAFFDILGMDVSTVGQDRNLPSVNIYANRFIFENPTIHYSFLGAANGYSDMAQRYRRALVDAGVLSASEESAAPALQLDFLCMTTSKSSVLGVPYQKKVVLSTLKEITAVVQNLHKKGVTRLAVRLKGFGKSGLENTVADRFQLDPRVGTLAELKNLADLLAGQGGQLYLDLNVSLVYHDVAFNSYKQSSDSAKQLDRGLVKSMDFDRVTLQYSDAYNEAFVVSPAAYGSVIDRFLQSFEKKASKVNALFSWSTAGQVLTSDFNPSNYYDVCRTADTVRGQLKKLSRSGKKPMIDGGSLFAAAGAGYLSGLTSTSSRFAGETASVPFAQLVFSGLTRYSAAPIDLAGKADDQLLTCLETASDLKALWITKPDDRILNTGLETTYYSLNYEKTFDSVVSAYQTLTSVRTQSSGGLSGHEIVSQYVTLSRYQNGLRVLVNRSRDEVNYEGATVSPGSYLVLPNRRG